MTWRWLIGLGCAAALLCVFSASPVFATPSLKISPLRYDTSLGAGEKKKGFVDITNSSAASTDVRLSVQAFRQTNDDGALEFYDSKTIQDGVLLDYSEVELGAHETLHLAFLIDGSKLSSGDNFGAIFASTVPDTSAPGQQTVRVGTLLIISNGTPSARAAEIKNLSGQLVQISDGLRIAFDVHNTAEAGAATGFSPTITVRAWPYLNETVTGPLVFAGRTRTVEYVKRGDYIGILAIRVKTGTSEQVVYRLALTGYWRLLLPILITAAGVVVWFARYVKRRASNSGTSAPITD